MTERRPHWDDDLIDAVRDAVDIEFDEVLRLTEDSILAVIAAVEDWVYDNFQGGEYDNPVEYTPEELAIQRVRELCDGADQHRPRIDGYLINRTVPVEDIRRALEGDSDD